MVGRRVVLHIGAPKSGTTYVQSRLHRNAAELAEHGVLVPRARPGEGPASLGFRAALDLTGVRMGRGRAYSDGYWPRLVDLVAEHPGVSVVSDEAFVRADDAAARRAVAELGAAGAEVDVVYTARDLARQLVSGWLEGLKHGRSQPFAAYLDAARSDLLKAMRAYELPPVLGRWRDALAEGVGERGRLHLVTVPPEGADRSLLWTRFLDPAGIDPAWTPAPAARANAAVGLAEAQLLRLLNERLGDDARRGRRLHGVVRDVVVGQGWAGDDATRVRLDPGHADWVAQRTTAWTDWVRHSGVRVVGDLADLVPAPVDPAAWTDPDEPRPGVAAGVEAAHAAVLRAGRRPV